MGRYSSSGIHVIEHGGVLVLHNEGLLAHGDGRYFPGELESALERLCELPAEQICRLLRREIAEFAPIVNDIELVVLKPRAIDGAIVPASEAP